MKLNKKAIFQIFLLMAALFATDFLIKRWVHSSVTLPVEVFRSNFGIDFFIQHVTNRGGAWGILSNYHEPLLLFRIGVIIYLVVYFFRYCTSQAVATFVAMIIVGSLANVIDCFIYGHVIDMFHFTFAGRSYGIFNLADAVIFVGCIGLMSSLFKKDKVKNAGRSK